jgi:hypothetical protein
MNGGQYKRPCSQCPAADPGVHRHMSFFCKRTRLHGTDLLCPICHALAHPGNEKIALRAQAWAAQAQEHWVYQRWRKLVGTRWPRLYPGSESWKDIDEKEIAPP